MIITLKLDNKMLYLQGIPKKGGFENSYSLPVYSAYEPLNHIKYKIWMVLFLVRVDELNIQVSKWVAG